VNVFAAISRLRMLGVSESEAAEVARADQDPQFPLAARLPLLVRDLDGRAGGDGFESLGGAARERIRRHAPEHARRAAAPGGSTRPRSRSGRLP